MTPSPASPAPSSRSSPSEASDEPGWKRNRRAKRDAWVEAGLCSRCGGERDEDWYKTCAKCRGDSRRSGGERYQRLKAQGLCTACGKRPIDREMRCEECLARYKPPGRKAELARNWRSKHRQAVLDAYGGKCACCGEDEPLFLDVDHVDNDGAEHRKQVPIDRFYPWLRSQGYPPDFQLLCRNCNWGKHRNGGTCPHQED